MPVRLILILVPASSRRIVAVPPASLSVIGSSVTIVSLPTGYSITVKVPSACWVVLVTVVGVCVTVVVVVGAGVVTVIGVCGVTVGVCGIGEAVGCWPSAEPLIARLIAPAARAPITYFLIDFLSSLVS